MSAPPPPYQNQPPQQPQQSYGYQQPQQSYGYQQPPQQPQQPYGYQQPPSGPQRPQQSSPLRGLITAIIVLAVFGGGAWYVWDYNTNPNGGKAKAEASQSARARENKKHDPQTGDCIKVDHTNGDPLPTIVDCGSTEAQYKAGDRLYGPDKQCASNYDYSLHYSGRHTTDYTLCFTKV